jgi:penicillin-binding protein 1C
MLLPDVPTQYDGFAPRNFDERYNGAVPADEALARSLNVPAVRNLRTHGIDRTLRTLRTMGLASINHSSDHYGLSLIMGGAECSLWELAGAYASMARVLHHHARGGRAYHPGDIHPPLLLAGEHADTSDAAARSPLSAASIHWTLKALREVARPEEEAGWRNFQGQRAVAWKTGTSVGHRDAWAIGVTDRWCVGVWTGNASGEGRPGLTGTLAAAPLLFDVFAMLPAGPGFDAPEDELVPLPICARSGHRAGLDCPAADTLRLPAACARTPVCPYHRTITLNAAGTHRVPPPGAMRVPWFVLPPAMERYYLALHPDHRPLPPAADGAGADEVTMEVLYPERGARLLIPVELDGSMGRAVVELAHRDGRARVHWDLDGAYLGATVGDHRMALCPEDGGHVLTFTDDAGRSLRHPFRVVRRNGSTPNAVDRTGPALRP